MTLLLQVSDPHFGTERPEVVDALLRLAAARPPDVVVLSGDITQRATVGQFQAARAFMDRLAPPGRTPRVVIPGNHDLPLFNLGLRLLQPYRRHLAAFGPGLEQRFASPQLLVLGLNTTRWWRHQDGTLSQQQIETVAHALERSRHAHPAQWQVVVTHQPIAVTRPEDADNLLHGHRQALQRWSAAGADVVMGGHIHLPYVVALHASAGPPARPMWAVQAGTALSTRLRREAGNSVNLLHVGDVPDAAVERWDYDDAARQFLLRETHRLQR